MEAHENPKVGRAEGPPATEPYSDPLSAEATVLGRYILGRDVSPQLAERYASACAVLHRGPHADADVAVVEFALRHPRLLPCLDAALGLRRPDALLRRKLLTLVAVLEASPDHADFFAPRSVSKIGAIARLAAWGAAAAVKCVAGMVLLPLAGRRR
jgi:hypothetical protein